MSKAGLIIALVLAAVLSIVAYTLLKPKPTPPPSGPLIGSLDIGHVRTIDILWSTGRHATLSLGGPGDAYWLLDWATPAGKALKWPAGATRVRAALRLLAALKPAPDAGPGPVSDPATRITLIPDSGPPIRLRMSESTLGGRTPVSVEGAPGVALGDEGLAQVFASDLGAWREPAVFPIDPADASRIELSGGPTGVSLSRVGKTWAVVKPVAVPGDGPLITEILKLLGATAASRFTDEPGPSDPADTTPRITVEIDRRVPRDGEIVRSTIFQELVIGGPADVGGQSLLCRAAAWVVENDSGTRTDLWGPVAVVVTRQALETVSTEPDAYIARTATRTAPADVGGLDVLVAQKPGHLVDPYDPIMVVRTADGWSDIKDKRTPSPPDAPVIADLVLKLVTQDRAQSVLPKAPASYVPVAIVSLYDRAKSQLDSFEIGFLAPPGTEQKTLCIATATIYRVYSGPSAAAFATWLASRFTQK